MKCRSDIRPYRRPSKEEDSDLQRENSYLRKRACLCPNHGSFKFNSLIKPYNPLNRASEFATY